MGARCSRESSSVSVAAAAAWTAKVVLPDGGLREYIAPVTAAGVLGKDAARFFVCDADEMQFDGLVSALGADEGLHPGQLYFVLPRSTLRHPLQAEDLAALAVKASAALVGSRGPRGRGRGRGRGKVVAPLVFPDGAGEMRGEEKRRRTTKAGCGGGRKFAPELSLIPE